jgi:hypothetical protein
MEQSKSKPTDSHAQGTRYFCGICGGTSESCTHQRELAHAQGTTPAKYWQCPNDETHPLTFKGLPLDAKAPYCMKCPERIYAVFQSKPSAPSVSETQKRKETKRAN